MRPRAWRDKGTPSHSRAAPGCGVLRGAGGMFLGVQDCSPASGTGSRGMRRNSFLAKLSSFGEGLDLFFNGHFKKNTRGSAHADA